MRPCHISAPADLSQLGDRRRGDASRESDGICHCAPAPESSAVGECPRCHRLDIRKAFA